MAQVHARAIQRDGLESIERRKVMGIILLEALAAGLLLIFIVWWTMFSGRKNGEPPREEQTDETPSSHEK